MHCEGVGVAKQQQGFDRRHKGTQSSRRVWGLFKATQAVGQRRLSAPWAQQQTLPAQAVSRSSCQASARGVGLPRQAALTVSDCLGTSWGGEHSSLVSAADLQVRTSSKLGLQSVVFSSSYNRAITQDAAAVRQTTTDTVHLVAAWQAVAAMGTLLAQPGASTNVEPQSAAVTAAVCMHPLPQ